MDKPFGARHNIVKWRKHIPRHKIPSPNSKNNAMEASNSHFSEYKPLLQSRFMRKS